MKKYKSDQIIIIRIPGDPLMPAEVEFTPGPYLEEAHRLASQDGSGWQEANSDILANLPKQIIAGLSPATVAELAEAGKKVSTKFLVNRKIVMPKPLRKPRPDASERLKKRQEAKAAEAPSVDWGDFLFSD